MSRRKRVRAAEGTLLAGWLFADLLLALSVVFLGVVPGPPKPKKPPKPPTPPPIAIAAEGLDLTIVCLGEVDTTKSAPEQFADIGKELVGANASGRRAGFLILTGGTESRGVITAEALGERLKNETLNSELMDVFYVPPEVDPSKPDWGYRAFYRGTRASGFVSIEALFYNKSPGSPGDTLKNNNPKCGLKR